MIGKIFASSILISVLYVFGIFFAPNLSDSIAEELGIGSINTIVRQLKTGADSTSETLLQIQDASGAVNSVRDAVNQMNKKTEQISDTINTIRQVGEQKVEQVQKTVDSVRRVGSGIIEVQQNLSELKNLSGSVSQSGTTSATEQ